MDRREFFATEDVAHVSLEASHKAPRYSVGEHMRVVTPTADIHRAPDATGLERQSLYGREVTVLTHSGNHAFVRDETMGYVGYMPLACLGPWQAPTHRVKTARSLLFSEPNFKSPRPLHVSGGSLLSIQAVEGKFARTLDGQYALSDHLEWLDRPAVDPVGIAETFLGTPYLWGGNSGFGIDCSGLIQAGLSAAGLPCPGDSDQQQHRLGETLVPGSDYRRGDILFWKGHVAWVSDPETILHANAHHMQVVYEPLHQAISRIEDQGDGAVVRHARLTSSF